MALTDVKKGLKLTTVASHREPHRHRQSGLTLVKQAFNWDTQDMYFELINFKVEVTNIMEAKAYKLTEDKKSPW